MFCVLSLIAPCDNCAAPYGFKNVMALSKDTRFFSVSSTTAAGGVVFVVCCCYCRRRRHPTVFAALAQMPLSKFNNKTKSNISKTNNNNNLLIRSERDELKHPQDRMINQN